MPLIDFQPWPFKNESNPIITSQKSTITCAIRVKGIIYV